MSSTGKEQTTKAEVQSQDTAAGLTANPTVPATETTETHAQAAAIHSSEAKTKAGEAGAAAGESASQATMAAKEKLSQAGEATAQAAEATKEATKIGAINAADSAAQAGEKIADATAVAREKLTEAGETVQTGVHSALEFIKEHLPRVEHEDLTPEERQNKALLDEAMGRPGETTPGLPSEVEVIDKTRPIAERMVAEGAMLDQGGAPEPGPLPMPVPSELLGGEKEEERSVKGLAEVMEEKAGAAKEYVR
jgi:hypothetical protein